MPVSQRVKLSGGYEWKKKKKKKKKRNVWRHTRGKPRRTAALSCGTPSWRSGEEVLHHPPCAAWQSGGETWLLPGVVLSLGLWTHHSRNITGTKKVLFPASSVSLLPASACVTVRVCNCECVFCGVITLRELVVRCTVCGLCFYIHACFLRHVSLKRAFLLWLWLYCLHAGACDCVHCAWAVRSCCCRMSLSCPPHCCETAPSHGERQKCACSSDSWCVSRSGHVQQWVVSKYFYSSTILYHWVYYFIRPLHYILEADIPLQLLDNFSY